MDTREDRLAKIADLPDTAVLPVKLAAEHDGVSTKTVYRTYPLVKLSPGRCGVLVGYLRHRGKQPTAA